MKEKLSGIEDMNRVFITSVLVFSLVSVISTIAYLILVFLLLSKC